jgi:hypothetical protein
VGLGPAAGVKRRTVGIRRAEAGRSGPRCRKAGRGRGWHKPDRGHKAGRGVVRRGVVSGHGLGHPTPGLGHPSCPQARRPPGAGQARPAWPAWPGQGRAGQARPAWPGHQGRPGQGRAGQGRPGEGRGGQGRAGQGRAGQGLGLGHLTRGRGTEGAVLQHLHLALHRRAGVRRRARESI